MKNCIIYVSKTCQHHWSNSSHVVCNIIMHHTVPPAHPSCMGMHNGVNGGQVSYVIYWVTMQWPKWLACFHRHSEHRKHTNFSYSFFKQKRELNINKTLNSLSMTCTLLLDTFCAQNLLMRARPAHYSHHITRLCDMETHTSPQLKHQHKVQFLTVIIWFCDKCIAVDLKDNIHIIPEQIYSTKVLFQKFNFGLAI